MIFQSSSPAYALRGKYAAEKIVTDVPGPGKYCPNGKVSETAIAHGFTFGHRSGSIEGSPKHASKTLVPGPGNYQVEGSFMVKKGGVFGTEIRPSIEGKQKVKIPGPGAYEFTSTVRMGKAPNYV